MCESMTDGRRFALRLRGLFAAVLGLGLALAASGVRADEARGGSEGFAATAAHAGGSDEEILLARAREYWDARGRRLGKVMEFYAPPEKGGPKQPKDVSEFGNVTYTDWKVERAQVDGDRGIVDIRITAAFPLPAPIKLDDKIWTRTIREEWLKVEGTWYKKPVPLGFSGASRPPVATTTPGGDERQP